MPLIKPGSFISHHGLQLPWKIDCDALEDKTIENIAAIVATKIQFWAVIGIPRGGLRLAAALGKYASEAEDTLIVDDVLTTGKSMQATRASVAHPDKCIGLVLFARTQCPDWIIPLFSLDPYWNASATHG